MDDMLPHKRQQSRPEGAVIIQFSNRVFQKTFKKSGANLNYTSADLKKSL
jgi:hypothetical protein